MGLGEARSVQARDMMVTRAHRSMATILGFRNTTACQLPRANEEAPSLYSEMEGMGKVMLRVRLAGAKGDWEGVREGEAPLLVEGWGLLVRGFVED